jgi:hypothetical protein
MTSSRLGTHNKSTNWLGCLETSSAVAGLADDINIARRILAKAVAYSPNDTLLNRMSGPLVAAQLARPGCIQQTNAGHLELGRTLECQHKVAEARREDAAFLYLWRDGSVKVTRTVAYQRFRPLCPMSVR